MNKEKRQRNKETEKKEKKQYKVEVKQNFRTCFKLQK